MQDDYKQSDQITPWLIYSSQPSKQQVGKKLTKISLILDADDDASQANTSQILAKLISIGGE